MPDIDDALGDLDETDPRKLIIEIEKRLRPQIRDDAYVGFELAYRYYCAVKRACNALGIQFTVPEPQSRGNTEGEALINMTKLEIELIHIDILTERVKASEAVALDDNWRGRIHSYLAHIRPLVERADIPIGLRDSILEKINNLSAEVDRSRTRVRAAGDLLIELCAIAGAAANELRPVIAVAEKIVGAFLRLQHADVPQLALPPPEGFGLPVPEETPPAPRQTTDI